jgi:hypothetical protein
MVDRIVHAARAAVYPVGAYAPGQLQGVGPMHRYRRGSRAGLELAMAVVILVVGLTLPARAFACLAYEAASDFSFVKGLNLAVVGRVASVLDRGEQPHARVVVDVKTTIAGAPGATVEVDMGLGCTHPAGEVGDDVVIAAGAPGANFGVFVEWKSGPLIVDNSATWIIRADGSIASGPTIDGHAFASRAELLSALRAALDRPQSAFAPRPGALGGFGFAISVIIEILVRAYLYLTGGAGH